LKKSKKHIGIVKDWQRLQLELQMSQLMDERSELMNKSNLSSESEEEIDRIEGQLKQLKH
jgi:hypothetical protein